MSMIFNAAQVALPRRALALLLAVMTLLSACSDNPAQQPTISVQPTDTSAVAGTAATLSVTASGSDISYQWQVSSDGGTTFANVTGATSNSHTTPTLGTSDNGNRYRVVVTAAGISVNSSAVTLTVTAVVVAPAITVAPAALSVTAPAPAVFSVTATGTAVNYQWQRSTDGGTTFVSITGAAAATYDAGATTTAMNGERYRVVISNASGSVTSVAAILSVNPAPAAPAFTAQAQNQAVIVGSAAAFSVAVTGVPAPTLQWQRSTDGGTTFANIAGATDATYNTGTTSLSQNGERYRVMASSASGNATSNAATLTVNPAPQIPAISTQPTAMTVTAPATATFTAAATGVPTPTWQWQLSTDGGSTFANITGATSASYTTPATVAGDSPKQVRAVASNASGMATSNGVLLTVTAAPAGLQWQTAAPLRGADGFAAERAVVAAGANGEFIAAWLDTHPAGLKELRTSRYTAGQGWSAPVAVATVISTSGATMAHAIAMGPTGNAVVVFTSVFSVNGSTRQSLWASRQDATGPWSMPVLLENEDGGHAELPAVAIDGQDVATVVWQQNDTIFFPNSLATRRIVASRAVAGQAWAPMTTIDLASGGNGTGISVRVAANAGGDVVATWTASTPIGQVATANVFRAGSGWVGAQLLVTDTVSSTQSVAHAVAINDAGAAVVAFRRLAVSASSVYATRYAPATGWASPELLGRTADAPTVALAANGTATVAWEASPGNQISVTRALAGGAWSTPQAVSDGFAPQARIDTSGNVNLVWLRNPTAAWTVASARWPAAGVLSAATVIESLTTVRSTFVPGGLAVGANGQAAAVWVEEEAPVAAPWANVFR